jgi:predicted metal-dependent hydrolase
VVETEEIAGLQQGIADFRNGLYFEAHDAWEEVWRELNGRRRIFWQAMIQLAVGTHHWNNGNRRGCQSVWNKALNKCDTLGQQYDTDVPAPLLCLIAVLYDCLMALEAEQDPLPLIADFAATTLSDQWVTFA